MIKLLIRLPKLMIKQILFYFFYNMINKNDYSIS